MTEWLQKTVSPMVLSTVVAAASPSNSAAQPLQKEVRRVWDEVLLLGAGVETVVSCLLEKLR